AADPVRAPGYRQEPDRARPRHAGGAAPACGRHGVVHPRRAWPATPGPADHRGHGDDADGGPVGRAAHLDGHRRPGVRSAPGAGGAVTALFLTLFASVRRRRQDLAVLKTIGFTRRQLAATVAWQATVAAIVGSAVGIPLGIALGRWLWTAFARQIYAVPQPAVP